MSIVARPVISDDLPIHASSQGNRIIQFKYIRDDFQQLNLQSVLQRFEQGSYQKMTGQAFNIGNSDDVYWIMFSVINDTQIMQKRRLVFGAPFLPQLNVYLLTEQNIPQTLMKHNGDQKYSGRVNDAIKLNSNVFSLPAKSQVKLLIQYQPRGVSFLPISIETDTQFFSQQIDESIQSTVFYSFCLAFIITFILIGIAMQSPVMLAYVFMFLQYIFFMAIIEGYAFKYFWPDQPVWNMYSGLVVGLTCIATGFLVASKSVIQHQFYNQFRNYCLSLSVVSLLLLVFIPFTGNVILMMSTQVLMLLMIVAQVYCIFSWLKFNTRRNLLALYSVLILTVAMFYTTTLFFNSSSLSEWMLASFNRLMYLFVSLMTMSTFTIHLAGLRKDHEQSLQKQLSNAKHEVELNRALFESEQRYSEAKLLANKRQMQLASVSHDIRQPLMSLRSTIDSMSMNKEQKPDLNNQLHNAFQYIEELCTHYLAETRPQTQAHDEHKTESYCAKMITDTLDKMFRQEAMDKNLIFHVIPSSVEISCPPMPLIRIVSNFVSNAIKHCDKGRVIVGCRRLPGRLRFDIYDQGKGLSAEQLKILQQPYQKGENSQGEGLGLAITKELADNMGWEIEIKSLLAKGSRFSVLIPL